jgi:phosphatidylethanolamine/phosphatidyl-N-methylethanolamine N-methyltransferase
MLQAGGASASDAARGPSLVSRPRVESAASSPAAPPLAAGGAGALGAPSPKGTPAADAHDSLLYGDLSRVYDLIFARLFYPRIARVIRRLEIPPGARVLEIGVGTGLSLAAYPSHCRVTGLDLSADMLKHARRKVERLRMAHVELVEGDALHLPFPSGSFDFAMAFYVITVVPDHVRLLAEARRVLKPGGTLVVVNHFRSRSPWLSRLEQRLEPVSRRWGWHTLEVGEATRHMGDARLHAHGIRRGSLFTVLVARPRQVAGQDDAEP